MSPPRYGWLRILGMAAVVGILAVEALGGSAVHAAENEAPGYLPADAEAVVFVNLRQILDAPLVKKHALPQVEAALKTNADARKLLSAIGLDPMKDLQSLLLASAASASTDKVLIVIRGNFNLDRIHAVTLQFALAHPDQLKITSQDGLRIYEGKSDSQPIPAYVVFLDNQTLLASPSRAYLLAAARHSGPVKAELKALIAKTNARASIWLVALATVDLKKALAANPQTAGIADKLVAFTGSVTISENVEASIHIFTKDPRSAEDVGRLLDGLKSIASFVANTNEEYGDLIMQVIDAFKISNDKNSVTLSVQISDSLIEKGLKKK